MGRLTEDEYYADLFAPPSMWPGHYTQCRVFYYPGMVVSGMPDAVAEREERNYRTSQRCTELRAFLASRSVAHAQIADEIGVARHRVADRLCGRTEITAEDAERLRKGIVDANKTSCKRRRARK